MNSAGKAQASLVPSLSATMEMERKIAQEIMDVVHQLELPLELDTLTKGDGNCFPLAILQQCKRPEVFSYIRPAIKRFVNREEGHSILRREVRKFVTKSKTQRVMHFRAQYEQTDGLANKESWDQYWDRMVTDKTWVDYWFIQATAWYLQLDMWIITTSSTNTSPYIEINGNFEEGGLPCNRAILILGTKSNCHYQSLLPIELTFHPSAQNVENKDFQIEEARKKFNEMTVPDSTSCKPPNTEHAKLFSPPPDLTHDESTDDESAAGDATVDKDTDKFEKNITTQNLDSSHAKEAVSSKGPSFQYPAFVYCYNNTTINFSRTTDDYQMKCPNCFKESKQIVQHLAKSMHCRHYVDIDSFKAQFKIYKMDKSKEDQNNWKRASRSKLQAQNKDKVKENEKKWKKESLSRQRNQNNGKVKQMQRDRKTASRQQQTPQKKV